MAKLKSIDKFWLNGTPIFRYNVEFSKDEIVFLLLSMEIAGEICPLYAVLNDILEKKE